MKNQSTYFEQRDDVLNKLYSAQAITTLLLRVGESREGFNASHKTVTEGLSSSLTAVEEAIAMLEGKV